MKEEWKPVPGFAGLYEVSNKGRVRSLPFMQRYLLRTGVEAYRKTKQRILSQQLINSGYYIAHLHAGNKRRAFLVHRLVAEAFVPGGAEGMQVNHLNGKKTNNAASNLEWTTCRSNHLHAVACGLNPQAVPVVDPSTGKRYDSISQAAAGAGKAHRTVRKTFKRSA